MTNVNTPFETSSDTASSARELEQWQYEVTGAGRVWYCPDLIPRIVWMTDASSAIPKLRSNATCRVHTAAISGASGNSPPGASKRRIGTRTGTTGAIKPDKLTEEMVDQFLATKTRPGWLNACVPDAPSLSTLFAVSGRRRDAMEALLAGVNSTPSCCGQQQPACLNFRQTSKKCWSWKGGRRGNRTRSPPHVVHGIEAPILTWG